MSEYDKDAGIIGVETVEEHGMVVQPFSFTWMHIVVGYSQRKA